MKSEIKICIPFYKIAYSASFIIVICFIHPIIYVNEIGAAIEEPMALLTAIFCADTYLIEVQCKRSEVFRLYSLKQQIRVVFRRLWIQIFYLSILSFAGYGIFYWQKPVKLVPELTNGISFGIFCIAIVGTIVFWSVLSLTICNLWRNMWAGIGSVFILWFGFISKGGDKLLGKWNPFSYSFCDMAEIMQWNWLCGKIICVILAMVLLVLFPKILKKRG